MGEVLPRSHEKRIQFFEQRIEEWSRDPEAIGLNRSEIEELRTLAGTAKLALDSAESARRESQRSTQFLTVAIDRLMSRGRPAIAKIKAHARSSSQAEVLRASKIPEPSKPGLKRAPERPSKVKLRPISLDKVEITWSGAGERNVYFTIHRMTIGGQSEFVGTTGSRRFVVNVPAGETDAAFAVRAHRGELASPQTGWHRLAGSKAPGTGW